MSLFVSIINPANKNSYDAYPFFSARGCPLFDVQNHSPCDAHWAYKGYLISPGEYQAYETYYFYFQSTPRSLQGLPRSPRSCGLLERLVATVIELLELSLQG